MKIIEKVRKIKEKYTKIDKQLMLNWSHILTDNCSIRSTYKGIKIELRKKKD